MESLRITVRDIVVQRTIKNLLAAQERLAEEGNMSELIRVSEYMLRVCESFGDVLVDAIPERNEWGCGDPVKRRR